MIGSLLTNLVNHGSKNAEPTPEELKRERVNFHRERVRNGPAKFSTMTSGQIRRAQQRDLKARQRKQFKRTVKNHFGDRRNEAILRGQLQLAGILPLSSGEHDDRSIDQAVVWIYDRFGEKVEKPESKHIEAALQAAWERYTELTGLPYAPLEHA